MQHRARSPLIATLVVLVALCQLPALAHPPQASAAWPGAQGLIAWQKNDATGSHIWTMHPDGSAKTQIATGSMPTWSPDGSRVLFVSSAGLTTTDPSGGGATVLLDHGLYPTWSPDGSKIAFAYYDNASHQYDIYVMDANGTNVVNISNNPAEDLEPRWSPDGTKIAFRSARSGSQAIWVMGSDGSNPIEIPGTVGGSSPDWSPDGTRIAFAYAGGIWVMNADGSGKVRVSNTTDMSPAWSPDGTRIVFTSHRDYNDELYSVAADGSGALRLTNDNASGSTYPEDWFASWQPTAFATTPVSVAFGNGVVGTASAPKTVAFVAGTAPVAITTVSIAGANAGDFGIVSDGCGGTVVAARATCTVSVRFKATATGARTASLTLDGPAPLVSTAIPLTGFGHLFLWGATRNAGPAYTWSYGSALAATVAGSATYLHTVYSTGRIGSSWAKDTGPYVGVYYIRSSNTGATWTTAKRLNPTTQHGSRASIASSGAYVYATWVSTTRWFAYRGTAPRVLFFRRNSANGSTAAWGSTVRLTSTTGRVDYPVLAASGAHVYVAYADSATGAIKVAISANRGTTWRTVTVGTTTLTNSSGRIGLPSIAASGSAIAVSWISSSAGTVTARIGSAYGASWGLPATIGTTTAWGPSAAALGNRVGVAWTTSSGISVRVATASVWGPEQSLPPTDGYGTEVQFGPVLGLLGSGGVAVAYSSCIADCTRTDPATITRSDLVWRQSPDNGATWAVSEVLATSTTSARRENDTPSILWRTAKRPFVLWNGWTESTNSYRLYFRAGL